MISKECFSVEYIQQQCKALEVGEARAIQIEKSIHALALLGHLAKTDLQFIFKGGTSLLLHLPRIKRLSIDVDIMSDVTDEVLADTKNVAIQLCCHDLDYENADAGIVERLKKGIRELKNHLVRDPFRETREAKIAAAKAYLLAEHIRGAVSLSTERLEFDISAHLEFIKKTEIKAPFCLNRLKETVPEAFYYLALAMGSAKTGINQ